MAQTAEILRKGLALHNSGDYGQAEQEYRNVLRIDPRHADALHLIGVLGQQRGNPSLAVEYIAQAISVDGANAAYHTNLAAAHQALARFADAESCCRRAIEIAPQYAEAHYNLGVALESQNRLDEAERCYRRAIELKPSIAEAHLNLGNILRSQDRPAEAEQSFRDAISSRPQYAPAHYNLGNLLHARGENEAAVACYRNALELNPQYSDALYNLGVVLDLLGQTDAAIAGFREVLQRNPQMADAAYRLGVVLTAREELEEAAAAFERAIEIRPGHESAWNNLGQIRQFQGRAGEAEECFRRAIELRPGFASAWNNLAVAQRASGQSQPAIASFRKALELDSQHVHANINLGTVLVNAGALAEAAECFARVLARDPGHVKARILSASLMPPVYSSAEELRECRSRLENGVRALLAEGVHLDPEKDTMVNTFYLPYQGLNDRDLQRDLARLYPVPVVPVSPLPPGEGSGVSSAQLGLCPHPQPLSRGERGVSADKSGVSPPQTDAPPRIRVGFISHHFRSHTIGHLMRGLIAELSRSRFSVTVFSIGEYRDELADAIRAAADEYVVLPTTIRRAREMIAGKDIDVLFYSDIGMDPYTYSLAFHRLASVQCVTWGHPVTTGIPNVDYFLSSELLEPDDAAEHYTEQLVRLSGLPTYYYRPAAAQSAPDRARLGIPEGAHLYLCPQSLFKFHPDFDSILKEILSQDPLGLLVLVEGIEPAWTEALRDRFRRSFPESIDRVQFLPRSGRGDFLGLLSVCDVMLDPFHFGGGNTTYEALALGVPIVTLPSGFMRGRVTAACYHKMGLDDCIARSPAEYVELAVRLAGDPARRRTMQSRILAANRVLFEDRDALCEIEAFLEAAVRNARQPEVRTLNDVPQSPPLPEGAVPGTEGLAPSDSPPAPASTLPRIEPIAALADLLRAATCPACGHHVAVPFYDGGRQPLATVAWPRTADEARGMKQLPLDFVRCVDCGHVYNRRFNYSEVPYSDKPNLMFNKGAIWTDHLRHVCNLILKALPERPVVVEIGCGEGHLLRALAERRAAGRYIGFDPSGVTNTGGGLIEARRELFDPSRHLSELRPDLMISRHVLEHLMNPLGFVQEISFAASWENVETRLFIEVPCIDQVIGTGRTVDFFYEHNSNFTSRSLERLLARCASEVELVARGYGDEVVYGLALFRRRDEQVRIASEAVDFCERAARQRASIRQDVDQLVRSGRRVAVWGGTGKAAAFINQNGLDAKRFPLVVDSDLDKAGTYVPGSGQEIVYRDILIGFPAEVILIATQWRAADIVAEIERCGILCQTILLEHEGRLVDYYSDKHPYRAVGKAA